MQVKLRESERVMLVDILKNCYKKALERKQTCYVMLDLYKSTKGNRFVFGPCPNAGYLILAEVKYTADCPMVVFVAWPLLCPGVPHGRFTEFGRRVCESLPVGVW